MIYLLANLPRWSIAKIEIIEVNQFPGGSRYLGLGQLPSQAIRSCWHTRYKIKTIFQTRAQLIWQAMCDNNPSSLISLLTTDVDKSFLNIKPVLKRHLQELPHIITGLSLTQFLGLKVLMEQSDKNMSVEKLFAEYQQREPLPFLGDLMFWALIKPLTEGEFSLIKVTTEAPCNFTEIELSITEDGKRCLEGINKWEMCPHWVGGINISSSSGWYWDHQNLETILQY